MNAKRMPKASTWLFCRTSVVLRPVRVDAAYILLPTRTSLLGAAAAWRFVCATRGRAFTAAVPCDCHRDGRRSEGRGAGCCRVESGGLNRGKRGRGWARGEELTRRSCRRETVYRALAGGGCVVVGADGAAVRTSDSGLGLV